MTLCADVYNFVHFSGKNLKYMCNAEALCAHWCVCVPSMDMFFPSPSFLSVCNQLYPFISWQRRLQFSRHSFYWIASSHRGRDISICRHQMYLVAIRWIL